MFRAGVTGSRTWRKVLVEDLSASEQGGERYTVKLYTSGKGTTGDGEWQHTWIVLKPLNPDFESWSLNEGSPYRVIAEFVRVLD